MGSWFDILLLGLFAGALAFGFYQGLLRQAFLLLAMYIGVVLSAQYYGYLSGLLLRLAPSAASEVTDVISFIVLMTAFTIVVTWLIWTGYRETKLSSAVVFDNLGGAGVGGVVGLFAAAMAIMIANYALQAPWPDGSPIKYALSTGLHQSMLQDMFSLPMPMFQSALKPWLPPNVPFMS